MSHFALRSQLGRRSPLGRCSRLVLAAALMWALAGAVTAPASASVTEAPGAVTDGPGAVTEGPVDVFRTAATLRGSVIAGDAPATYEFQLGTTVAYGFQSSPLPLEPSTLATTVSTRVYGLKAGTIYHYRLVAIGDDGTVYDGQDETFSTALARPRRVTVRVSPRVDSAPRLRYTLSGEVVLPAGVSRQTGCEGYVALEIKRGSRALVVQWATINDRCQYSATVTVPTVQLRGHGPLAITVRFLGTRVLAPRVAAPVFVAVGAS